MMSNNNAKTRTSGVGFTDTDNSRKVSTSRVCMQIYDSFDELSSMQQEWDSFVEDVGSEIFLTYDWCRIWWKYYGKHRDLKVFVFRKDTNLVGIIPLFFERIWLGPVYVRALKIVGSDFGIFTISLPVQKQYLNIVIEKLLSDLFGGYQCDILDIGPLGGLYECLDELTEACRRFSLSYCVAVVDTDVHTYFKLANSWDGYLASLKKKERQLMRSCYKKIDKDSFELNTEFATADDFGQKFDKFTQIHQSQWQKLGKAGHFGDWPQSLQFHREVAYSQLKHNRLRLLEVRLTEDCFAYQYSYSFGDKYFELLIGRSIPDDLSYIDLGRVVFGEQLKNAIKEDKHYVDSMRGRYEYKLNWGGKLFPVKTIYIWRREPLVRARVFAFRILALLLRICYYRIWYCRIRPRLPFIRKNPLWKVWIRTNAFAHCRGSSCA